MRGSDTNAERRQFLEDTHRAIFGKGLDSLTPESMSLMTQTMADSAVLSDADVRMHYERTEQLAATGAVGIDAANPDINPQDSVAALQLLRRVLRREMDMRGLPTGIPVKQQHTVIDGRTRARALAATSRA